MHIFLIIGLAILGYLYFTGKMSRTMILPIVLGLLALFLLSRGLFPQGMITSAIAAYLGRGFLSSFMRGKLPLGRKIDKSVIAVPDDVIQARALLGVSADDDEAIIKQKYRKLLEQHHPDRGGDEDYARAINLAKDVLIKHRLNNKL